MTSPGVIFNDDGIVDEIAVERACHGDRIPLRPAERREAVRILTGRGYSIFETAEILGVSMRTVDRCRAALQAAT